jgi:hypothetical protein
LHILNKTTKITLNYGLGIAITALLFWSLYRQLKTQLADVDLEHWWPEDTWPYLLFALLLVPVNLGIEARKWQRLAGSALPLTYAESVKSLLGGIAFSMITPNRIGEYPGRILFLARKNSTRLISVSVLGGCTQLLAVLIFGALGLIYYNVHFPGLWPAVLLVGSLLITLLVWLFYWRFERWAPYLERLKWLRKFRMYGQMMGRFTTRQQTEILWLALLRFMVFTLQYYLMLRWMGIMIPLADGFFLGSLFFWAMAVIPSIALAELGIRGEVSLFLFHTFTANKLGILTATIGLWGVNLVIPALIGSILLLRLKLVR